MTRRALPLVLVVAAACGEEPLVGTFTSEVVQHDTCRVVGDGAETCTRDEGLALLRVVLEEIDDDRVWIHGLPANGDPDTSILGTRDQEGGFLFYAQRVQQNAETGCALTSSLQLSLAIDEAAAPEAVGVDPCVPLVGREIETTRASAECDDLHDPPETIVRIARRRWQQPGACSP